MKISRSHKIRTMLICVGGCILSLILAFAQDAAAQDKKSAEIQFQTCWKYDFEGSADGPVIAGPTAALFVRDSSMIESVASDTGKLQWSTDVGGRVDSNLLAGDENVYLVRTAGSEKDRTASLIAISSETGVTKWTTHLAGSGRFTLIMASEIVLGVSENGDVVSVSAADGAIRLQKKVLDQVTTEPFISGPGVLFVTNGVEVDSVDISNFQVQTVGKAAFKIRDLFGFEDDELAWGDDRGFVTAFSIGSGKDKWQFKTGAAVTSIARPDGLLLVGSNDNFIYALSTGSGERVWKKRISDRIASLLVIDDDTVLIETIGQKVMQLLNTKTGKSVGQIAVKDATPISVATTLGTRVVVLTDNSLIGYDRAGCSNKK